MASLSIHVSNQVFIHGLPVATFFIQPQIDSSALKSALRPGQVHQLYAEARRRQRFLGTAPFGEGPCLLEQCCRRQYQEGPAGKPRNSILDHVGGPTFPRPCPQIASGVRPPGGLLTGFWMFWNGVAYAPLLGPRSWTGTGTTPGGVRRGHERDNLPSAHRMKESARAIEAQLREGLGRHRCE